MVLIFESSTGIRPTHVLNSLFFEYLSEFHALVYSVYSILFLSRKIPAERNGLHEISAIVRSLSRHYYLFSMTLFDKNAAFQTFSIKCSFVIGIGRLKGP